MIDELRHLAHNIRRENGDLTEAEICERAANEIERLRSDFAALQSTLVGNTGLSAIMEAERLCRLHPLDHSPVGY